MAQWGLPQWQSTDGPRTLCPDRYARKKKDKDTSLPTMVKLDYSTTGRGDDDWEREMGRGERGGVSLGGLGAAWLGGLGSPPVTPQCSADV